jgi:hypothetical protein
MAGSWDVKGRFQSAGSSPRSSTDSRSASPATRRPECLPTTSCHHHTANPSSSSSIVSNLSNISNTSATSNTSTTGKNTFLRNMVRGRRRSGGVDLLPGEMTMTVSPDEYEALPASIQYVNAHPFTCQMLLKLDLPATVRHVRLRSFAPKRG